MSAHDLDDGGCINTDAGSHAPELKCTALTFIDQTTVIYGPSKTGKTVITKHIMKLLNGHIDQILIISPSEPSNRSYEGYVHPACIHYRMFLPDPANPKKEDGAKGALRFLEHIWKRQEMMASIAKRANNPEVLATLFRRLARSNRVEGLKIIDGLNRKRQKVVDRVRHQFGDDPGRCEGKVKDVNEKFRTMLTLLYKKYIIPERDTLWKVDGLSEEERYSLAYIQFNPRLLIIFDDCAAQMKSLFSKEILRDMFYRGRHACITSVWCCQDDTDIPTNLRKNAFVSFFTEPVVCTTNFNRVSNQFAKPIKATAADLSPAVFVGHRKMAYLREDDARQHFYWVMAPYSKKFRFGSDALWELCDSVKADGASMDEANPFFNRFRI